MKKLLIAGLLSAVTVVGAQASGTTNCHPGGFYAGLNVGFVHHKAQLEIKDVETDGTAAKLLKDMKKVKDMWEAIERKVDEAQKQKENEEQNVKTAETDSNTKLGAENTALEAAKKEYSQRLIHLYTATEAAAGTLNVNAEGVAGNAAALPAATALNALHGFSKMILNDDKIRATFAAANADLAAAITIGQNGTRNAYNDAIKKVIPEYVDKLFAGTLSEEQKKNLTVDDIWVSGAAAQVKSPFSDDIKKKNTAYEVAKTNTDNSEVALQQAKDALKNATDEFERLQKESDELADTFEKALGTDKTVKLDDLETDETVNAKIKAVNDLERNELRANSNGKLSKTKSGFVAETFFGFDHRVGDMMVGAELFVGFDTSKVNVRDKKRSDAREAGTANKAVKDSVEMKRQFYAGFAPRVGFMITPELEAYLMAGAQFNRNKVDATGMGIVYDHTTGILDQAVALNNAREKGIADATKEENEVGKKYFENIPVLSTEETFSKRNEQYKKHNKTKFAPIVGVGIKYAFTPDVFGTLQYKYQFNTKVIGTGKTGDFELKDQNHTFTVGVGFRF